jgi:hypothetical protein
VTSLGVAINGQQRGHHILESLQLFQHTRAANAKDKLYGMYGMHNALWKLPTIDYTKPTRVVYTGFTLEAMRQCEDLALLAFELSGATANLPSWVPDWVAKAVADPSYRRRFFIDYTQSNSAKGLKWSLTVPSPGLVTLSGVTCGVVDAVARDHFSIKALESDAVHGDILRRWYDFYCRGRKDSLLDPGNAVSEAFYDVIFPRLDQPDEQGSKPSPPSRHEWMSTIQAMIGGYYAGTMMGPSDLMRKYIAGVVSRRMFRFGGGQYGLAPQGAKVGDEVWILAGGEVAVQKIKYILTRVVRTSRSCAFCAEKVQCRATSPSFGRAMPYPWADARRRYHRCTQCRELHSCIAYQPLAVCISLLPYGCSFPFASKLLMAT